MDFNKLTIKSQEAVAAAQERARRLATRSDYPDTVLSLLDQDLPRALVDSAEELRSSAEETLAANSAPHRRGHAAADYVRRPRQVLDRAAEARGRWRRVRPRPSTCLLALDVVPRDQLLAKIKEVRGGQRVTSQDPEGTYQALEKFGRDLTALAEAGSSTR
jgi:ATP-dependent Clp protease ATP-binding subunit ClpB